MSLPNLVGPVEVCQAAREHLIQRVGVVGRLGHAERAVLILARQPVLEHDHRRDDIGAAQVRYVVALDAQRRLGEAEGFLEVGERLRAGHVVARAAGLVDHERLLGVQGRRLEQLGLASALGDLDRHQLAAPGAQPLLEIGRVVGHRRNEHLARDVDGRGIPVRPLEHLVDEVAARDVELLLDRRRAHTAHAAAADHELLDRSVQLVLGDAEQVGIRVGGQHQRALGQHGIYRDEPVPVDGGRFVVHRGGRLAHPGVELLGEPLVSAGHERDEVVDDRAVLLDRHLHRARAAAAPDLPGEARAPGGHRLLVARVAARADREDLDHQVDRVVHGPHLGVRTEVLRARDAAVARDDDPRGFVGQRDRHERVGLVVLVADVERRIELLDPHVLELQRVDVARHDRPLHGCRARHHPPRALVQRVQRREVVRQARAQVLRLADVQHAPGGIPESVHARVGRDLAGTRLVRDRGTGRGHAQASTIAQASTSLSRPCGPRRGRAPPPGTRRCGCLPPAPPARGFRSRRSRRRRSRPRARGR